MPGRGEFVERALPRRLVEVGDARHFAACFGVERARFVQQHRRLAFALEQIAKMRAYHRAQALFGVSEPGGGFLYPRITGLQSVGDRRHKQFAFAAEVVERAA